MLASLGRNIVLTGCRVSPPILGLQLQGAFRPCRKSTDKQIQLEMYYGATQFTTNGWAAPLKNELGVSHAESGGGSERFEYFFVCAKICFISWEKNLKFLRSPSIMHPWQLLEIFSLLSKPTAAGFGYSLLCSVLGRKEDAQLSSGAISENQNKKTQNRWAQKMEILKGAACSHPQQKATNTQWSQGSPPAHTWPHVLSSILQEWVVFLRTLPVETFRVEDMGTVADSYEGTVTKNWEISQIKIYQPSHHQFYHKRQFPLGVNFATPGF